MSCLEVSTTQLSSSSASSHVHSFCPLFLDVHWALEGGLVYLALWLVMNLSINCYPPQKVASLTKTESNSNLLVKHKYLEDSLRASLFNITTRVGLPKGLQSFSHELLTKLTMPGMKSPVEQASYPIREWLVSPITFTPLFHQWAHQYYSMQGPVLIKTLMSILLQKPA